MKNNTLKPLKQPKNKRKAISLILGTALASCSILAPFTAYTANADVVDNGNIIEEYVPNDYFRHPLGGFSLSCCDTELENVEVYDCPATYGGNVTYFSNRGDFARFDAWQNTTNGTFRVQSNETLIADGGSVLFQLAGFNVGLVREHISTIGWTIGTGAYEYEVWVYAQPILSTGDTRPSLISYNFFPDYWNDGQYKFYWADIFEEMPDEVYAENGTALFDMIWISFQLPDDQTGTPVFVFADEGDNTDIYLSSYAGRINALYSWIYNGSPIETIMKFPIDFLNTEIFPNFSFGIMLLIALGVLIFGLGLKIAFGG